MTWLLCTVVKHAAHASLQPVPSPSGRRARHSITCRPLNASPTLDPQVNTTTLLGAIHGPSGASLTVHKGRSVSWSHCWCTCEAWVHGGSRMQVPQALLPLAAAQSVGCDARSMLLSSTACMQWVLSAAAAQPPGPFLSPHVTCSCPLLLLPHSPSPRWTSKAGWASPPATWEVSSTLAARTWRVGAVRARVP